MGSFDSEMQSVLKALRSPQQKDLGEHSEMQDAQWCGVSVACFEFGGPGGLLPEPWNRCEDLTSGL